MGLPKPEDLINGQNITPAENAPTELKTILAETELLKARQSLELAKLDIKNIADFTAKKAELEKVIENHAARAQILSDNEKAYTVKESTLNAKIQDLNNREKAILSGEEKIKQQLVDARARIQAADDSHKKRRDQEDKERRDKNSLMTSSVDSLAQTIYNSHDQSITNRLREELIKKLEPVLSHFGIEPKFNPMNQYIPIEQLSGAWIGIEVKEGGRDKVEVVNTSDIPKNVRDSLKMCVESYHVAISMPVATMIYEPITKLVSLIENKTDEEIQSNISEVKRLFNEINKAVLLAAEMYQDSYAEWANYFCEISEKICSTLDIGVVDDTNMAINDR